MTKSVATEAALKSAEPLVHQHTAEIQAHGHMIRMPIADRDDDAGRLDAVAGSEFLDDRIRLRE